MKDILSKKGIKTEENRMTHPAEDGHHRYGIIRKELKIYSPSDWGNKETYSVVGLEINTWSNTIEVQFLKGTMPYANNLFWALLSDRDIRRMIVEYQKRPIDYSFKLWTRYGTSGCEDIFITFGQKYGGFATTRTYKICHISEFGRLNEGFGNYNSKMNVEDFVELVEYLYLTDDMNVKSLRRKAGVKYIRPKYSEEIDETFNTNASRIL